MGDGNPPFSTLIPNIPNYVYQGHGQRTIKLEIKDQFGASAVLEKEFIVAKNRSPVADINCFANGLQSISCQTFSYDPDGSISSITWELDDGTVINNNYFTHVFMTGDEHLVKLKVTDNFGESTIATQTVQLIMNKLPSFRLTADTLVGQPPLQVNFSAVDVIDLDGTITSYKWTINGEQVNGQNELMHTFSQRGVYVVRLEIEDDFGGTTQRSLAVTVGNQINVSIETDVESGDGPLQVHFNASNSSSYESTIIKYEWYLNNRKIGEGVEIDYLLDEVGENFIKLVVTDNYDVQVTKDKVITVNEPGFYIRGSFPDVAYVGNEYEASFEILGQDLDAVSLQLVDAPDGMTISTENKKIEWVPQTSDKGNVEFFLEVTNGNDSYQKRVNIDVYSLKRVGGSSSAQNGGTLKVKLDNDLQNAYLSYPASNEVYSMDAFLVEDVPWTQFIVNTSKPIKSAMVLSFERLGNEIFQEIPDYNLQQKSTNAYPSPVIINRRMRVERVCSNAIQFIKSGLVGNKYVYHDYVVANFLEMEVTLKDSSNKVFAANDSDPRVQSVINVLKEMNLDEANLNIYIMDKFKGNIANDYAFVPHYSLDSIYLNLEKITESFSANQETFIKYIMYHETFHITQNHLAGCYPANRRGLALKNLTEGAADYYSIKKLSKAEQTTVLKFLYEAGEDSFGKIHDAYEKIAKPILKEGFLSSDLDPYSARIFWEFSPVNMYTFFTNWGEVSRELIPKSEKEDVVKALRVSEVPGYISTLGAATTGDGVANAIHYLNNYYRADFRIENFSGNPSLPITSLIYDENWFNWKLPNMHQNTDFDDNKVDLTGVTKGHPKVIKLKIPPLGGRSFKFSGLDNRGNEPSGSLINRSEFHSQMNAMIKISYTNPTSSISSKILSVVESPDNGKIESLRQFKFSKRIENGKNIFIGARGGVYDSFTPPMNQPAWNGLNDIGRLEYAGFVPLISPAVQDYLWESGKPITESILIDLANMSGKEQEVDLMIEPLCEMDTIEITHPQILYLDMICDSECMRQKTINICYNGNTWPGYPYELCMFGNSNPMNTYDNGVRYRDPVFSGYPVNVYVCGENNNELGLLTREYR